MDAKPLRPMSVGQTLPNGVKVTEGASFTVACEECYTTGEVSVTTTGVKNTSFWSGVWDALTDPAAWVVNNLDLDIKIELENVKGYFNLDFTAGGVVTATIDLFTLYQSGDPSVSTMQPCHTEYYAHNHRRTLTTS